MNVGPSWMMMEGGKKGMRAKLTACHLKYAYAASLGSSGRTDVRCQSTKGSGGPSDGS